MVSDADRTAAIGFRGARLDDVDDLVALVESAYRGRSSLQGWTTEADLLGGQRTDAEEVAALVASRDGTMLLAERDGRVVGCAHLRRGADHAYFGMFAVRPCLQGAGIGGALLARAERIAARQWALPELRMQVISLREDLIGYYARRGYRKTGRRVPFPYGDARFGLPRRDDIEFELLVKELGTGRR